MCSSHTFLVFVKVIQELRIVQNRCWKVRFVLYIYSTPCILFGQQQRRRKKEGEGGINRKNPGSLVKTDRGAYHTFLGERGKEIQGKGNRRRRGGFSSGFLLAEKRRRYFMPSASSAHSGSQRRLQTPFLLYFPLSFLNLCQRGGCVMFF